MKHESMISAYDYIKMRLGRSLADDEVVELGRIHVLTPQDARAILDADKSTRRVMPPRLKTRYYVAALTMHARTPGTSFRTVCDRLVAAAERLGVEVMVPEERKS